MSLGGERWTLEHGEAVDFLAGCANRAADVALIDAPYSEDTHATDLEGSINRTDGGKARDAIDFPPLTWAEATDVSAELARVVRSWIVVFGDLKSLVLWRRTLEAADCEWLREGVWWKTDAQPQISGDRPAQGMEFMGLAHAPRAAKSGPMVWEGGGRHFRYMGPSQERAGAARVHPTQKPEWLMEALVKDFTSTGQTVLDCYAGSGTTGVAALRNGRKFIGCERLKKYYVQAATRLGSTIYQPSLFEPGPADQIPLLQVPRTKRAPKARDTKGPTT